MFKAMFRDRTRGLDVKVGIIFSKIGLTPNTWTYLSLLPAILGFISLLNGWLAAALISFIVCAFMDIIDGTVARVTDSVSNLGAFLDGVVDRYVEIIIYIGLWFYLESQLEFLLPTSLWFILLVFGATMPSFVTAYADHRNVVTDQKKLKDIGGFLERFERLGLIYFGMFLGLFDTAWLLYTVALTVILSNLTAFQRIYSVVRLK